MSLWLICFSYTSISDQTITKQTTKKKKKKTRSGSRWHAITNPHASGRNCPCTTQHCFKQPGLTRAVGGQQARLLGTFYIVTFLSLSHII